MNLNKKKIIVCGATGNQGSQVVKSLLTNTQWEVVALTRDPQSAKALKLQCGNVKIVKADLMDSKSLQTAFEGAYGVFGVTQPWSDDYKKCDPHGEIQQGKNIIAACMEAGVSHLVFSSVLNLDNKPTGVSHADSKLHLEELVKQSRLSYTILRCSQFMQNIGSDFFPVKAGAVKGFVEADAKVPYVSCEDIGKITARVFKDQPAYSGHIIDLIGDFVSGNELAQLLSNSGSGKAFKYKAAPRLLMWVFAREFYTMRRLFEKTGRPPYPAAVLRAMDSGHAQTDMKTYLNQTRFASTDN